MSNENGKESGTSRRAFLHAAGGAIGGISVIALTSSAEAAKVSQKAVGYQDSPKGSQNCANCRLFIVPNACKQVEGVVSPNGWCRIWAKAG